MKLTSTDISWHQSTWEKFAHARSNQHLPHALLLSGAQGTGKRLFANRMVKSLLCMEPIQQEACNNCIACKTYVSGANPDYMEIELLEGKQQISVDQIRKLSEFLNYTRSFTGFRVVLIEPVERMNRNAANSLLKSLEEPADNTVIILITTNLSSVIPTILSRCQQLSLPMPSKIEALSWLEKNRDYSDINCNIEDLLNTANGSPLLALDIPEDLLQEKEDLAADIADVINENKSITETAKKWEKHDHEILLNWQISWVQYFIKNIYIKDKHEVINDQEKTNTLLKLKEIINKNQLWILYQKLISQKHYIHTSVNPLIFMENMIVLWLEASK